jgi:hypothetical protein
VPVVQVVGHVPLEPLHRYGAQAVTVVPFATLVQEPVEQVAQAPHEALAQHVPPTQLFEEHRFPDEQALPFGSCATHCPPLHVPPVTQLACVVHVVGQASLEPLHV